MLLAVRLVKDVWYVSIHLLFWSVYIISKQCYCSGHQLVTNVEDKDEPNDRQLYTRSNAATARPLTLVRLAEI